MRMKMEACACVCLLVCIVCITFSQHHKCFVQSYEEWRKSASKSIHMRSCELVQFDGMLASWLCKNVQGLFLRDRELTVLNFKEKFLHFEFQPFFSINIHNLRYSDSKYNFFEFDVHFNISMFFFILNEKYSFESIENMVVIF